MEKILNIGLLGYGTVGSGIVHIIKENREKIQQITGFNINISKILVKDLKKERKYYSKELIITNNPDEILNDKNISIVVEVIGGTDLAKEYILKALNNGKDVITANKDLIALCGDELISTAQKNSCDLYFEASVAGGIPILRTLVNGFAGDKIKKVMGILNGTSNYILTKITNDKISYDEALKEAQELGFAESDPTNDVDGIDTGRKLAILTKLSFGMNVKLKDIEIIGIRDLKLLDFQEAEKLGYAIKLIGISENYEDGIDVRLGPTFIPQNHFLSQVNNENNAVLVNSVSIGETIFYGPGAGEQPTAISVINDIIYTAKNKKLGVNGKLFNNYLQETKRISKSNIISKYYLRFSLKKEESNPSKIFEILSQHNISFEKVMENSLDENKKSLSLITKKINNLQLENFLNNLKKESCINLEKKYEVIGE